MYNLNINFQQCALFDDNVGWVGRLYAFKIITFHLNFVFVDYGLVDYVYVEFKANTL